MLLGVVVALGGCDHSSMSPAAGPASSAPENTDDSRSKGPAPGEGIPSPADARAETAALGWPVMDATTIPVGETPWPLLFAGEPAPECQDGRFGEAAVHLYGPEGRTSVDVVTEAGARVLGLSDYGLRAGAAADFVVLPVENVPEAVVAAPAAREVWKNGRLIARDGRMLDALRRAA